MPELHPITKVIIQHVEDHIPPDGWMQWFVDELSIDCEADEFWRVVDAAVRSHNPWSGDPLDAEG